MEMRPNPLMEAHWLAGAARSDVVQKPYLMLGLLAAMALQVELIRLSDEQRRIVVNMEKMMMKWDEGFIIFFACFSVFGI